MWVWHNLPDRTDVNWILKGGGLLTKAIPAAKKFNAGQKMIFWSVIVLGASISVSGLSLLFPFELQSLRADLREAERDWGAAAGSASIRCPSRSRRRRRCSMRSSGTPSSASC